MSGKNDIVAGIRLDGEKEFKDAVSGVNKSLNSMKSELNLVKAEYAGQENSLEALTKKQEVLNKILELQKKKAEETRKGLNHAKESYENMGKSLDGLYIELEKATDKLEDLEKIYGSGSKEAEQQKKEVEKLNTAISRGTTSYEKAGNRVKDWETKLNNAQAQVVKANTEIGKNATYMQEAEKATDHCATSIDAFGKEIKKVNAETNTFKDSFLANIAGTGIGKSIEILHSGYEKVKDAMYDVSKASSDMAAKTGLSETAMKKYRNVMKEIKGDNFGEDYSDVSSVMSEIIQIIGELNGDSMKEVTESAIALRDTFEMDVNESLRAADVMMKTMGVDATEAFDLIAKGAQNGLNRSGELTDNITEYAQLWGQAGFSAEEMFAILENGLDSGAYNLDKVNDYVKEFGVSLADGRIEKNLSSFSTGTQDLFLQWKNGQASTKDVFYSVIKDLEDMENQQQALTLASEVWSALGEDNSMQVLNALNDLNDGYKNVKGTMESLKDVKYSDLESAVSNLGSAVQENITTPLAEAALPAITEAFDAAAGVINKIGEAITPQKTELQTFIEEIETSNDEVKTLLDNAKSSVSGSDTEIGNLEAYKTVLLDLNDIEGKTEYQKYQVKSAVEALSGSIPELAAAFDDETGSINLTNQEIVDLISNQENLIRQQAYAKASKEAMEALAMAQLNQAKASSAVEEAQKNWNEIAGAGINSVEEYIQAWGEAPDSVLAAERELKRAKGELDDANKSTEEAEGIVKKTQWAIESLTDAQEDNTNASEDGKDAIDGQSEALDDLAESAKSSADAQKEAAQTVLDAYENTRSQIESDLQNKISLFDMFDTSDGGEDVTVEDMTKNLDSQIEAFQNYQANLEAVKEHVGKEISPEFMQYIQDMGMEGANTLEHILQTFADEEPEKVKELNDKWIQAMDQSEAIAKAGAANKTAYELATGDFGSSDADFSDLYEAIDTAVSKAAGSWGKLPADTESALNQTIETAKQCGIKIPDGLAEGIASGSISPEDAISQLNSSIQGTFDGLAQIAKDQGIDTVDELCAGIESGEVSITDAFNSLISKITEQATAAKDAGTQVGSETASGAQASIESGTPAVEQASSDMASAGATAAEGKSAEYYGAGSKAVSEYTRAIQEAKDKAAAAGSDLSAAVKNAIASQTGFYAAGVNMASGVASGISDGASRAIAAARNMAASALAAAKAELEIHSPSKKFRDQVGAQISTGMAFGIKDKASLAGKAAKQMSNKVYANAVSWLSKYKKSQQVSLSDEKWYWQQVLKHTNAGTTAYNNALKKIQNITISELTATGLSSGIASKISNNFGVSKTTGSGKKKKTKDTETYYSEIYSAAQKYLYNQQVLNDWSLNQELAYWNAVKGQLQSGTQAWYDATKQINSLQADIAEAEKNRLETQANVQSDILNKYKTYYKVSATAEADYWDVARKQFQAGTDERIEADQNYFNALQELYDQRKELDEDYADNAKEINNQLIDDIQDLQDAYKDAVKSRKEDILSQMNLFEAWDSEGYDADTLLYNLKTQVAGLTLWEQQLEELEKKGIASGLMEELKAMGPDAAASIYSLNQMTAEQLAEYNRLWEQKNALAESQAVKDNESLRLDTNKQITQLRLDAQSELNALNADYRAAISELYTGMSGDLANLVNQAGSIGEDAVSSLIGSIGNAANSVETYNSTTNVVNTVSSKLSALQQEGAIIGKSTLDGLLAGLSDETKIRNKSQEVIQSIKRAMEEEAEIHSPAKLFRRETGPQIPAGVALGMEDGTKKAVKSAREMMQDTLAAAQEEIRKQQAAMQNQVAMLDYSGINRINRLMETPIKQSTVVNVDNVSVITAMDQIAARLPEMLSQAIMNLQMVTDTGVLAGEMQPLLDKANGEAMIIRNRGR